MKNKTILSVILFICIFALISAYFVEYILGYKPCNLCLIERLPYFFATIIITGFNNFISSHIIKFLIVYYKIPNIIMKL